MVQVLMGNFIAQRFGKHIQNTKSIIIDLKNSQISVKNCIYITCSVMNGKYIKSSYDLYQYLIDKVLNAKRIDLLTSNQVLKRMSQIDFYNMNKQDIIELPTIEQAIQFSIHIIKHVVSQDILGSQIQFFMDGFDPICQLIQIYQDIFSDYTNQYFIFLRSWICTGWLEHVNLTNNLKVIKQCVIIPFYSWTDEQQENQLLTSLQLLNSNYKLYFQKEKIIFMDFQFQKKNFVSKSVNVPSFLINVLENIKKHSYRVNIDKCWVVVPKLLDEIAIQPLTRQLQKLTQAYIIQDEIQDYSRGVILFFTGQQISEMQEFLDFKIQGFVQ